MLLTIDCGNTNTVFAVFSEKGEILGQWRASTRNGRTTDELGIWLKHIMLQDKIEPIINFAIIASVVPDNISTLVNLCSDYFGVKAMVVGDASVPIGISTLIDNPSEVGADRICNAVAGHNKYGGPLLVVDFGTATTFDVIDSKGNYCGGTIFPGINLSLDALHKGAAQLPRVGIKKTETIIGKNTVSAMASGIFWGHVSMIEGMIERIQEEFGEEMEVIATGGIGKLFYETCKNIDGYDENLTIFGLYLIFSNINSDR